jgi:predicted MFS family arabinose efflux permease
MALAYKLPSYIDDQHLGSESAASLMMAIIGFMGIPCGLIFNWLYQRIKQWIWPLCLLFNVVFYMISNAHVFDMLLVGCIILGTGFRLYFVTICDVID